MFNFVAHNPVKLHFGKGVVKQLGQEAAKEGKKALAALNGKKINNRYIVVRKV